MDKKNLSCVKKRTSRATWHLLHRVAAHTHLLLAAPEFLGEGRSPYEAGLFVLVSAVHDRTVLGGGIQDDLNTRSSWIGAKETTTTFKVRRYFQAQADHAMEEPLGSPSADEQRHRR